MVGLRGSQVHQWVVAGVAVLVLSGDGQVRARHRNQLAGLGIRLWSQSQFIRVNPVTRRQTGPPPRQGRHPTSWYRQAIKRSFARCGNNHPHSAGNASGLAATARSRCTCTRFTRHAQPPRQPSSCTDGDQDSLPIFTWAARPRRRAPRTRAGTHRRAA